MTRVVVTVCTALVIRCLFSKREGARAEGQLTSPDNGSDDGGWARAAFCRGRGVVVVIVVHVRMRGGGFLAPSS